MEARLADVGVALDDWQRGFGTIALGLDASDEFASTIGGVVASVPRQVGKTFTVGNLIIGLCLEFPGFQAIWTSHHGATTSNTLQSMQGMVRKPRLWPEIEHVYTNNNDMRIMFRNGSVIKFGAREHGFGRGLDAIDVLVFDEAQKLGIKALEDMVPATNQARNPHSGLVFFIGTPPRPIDNGEAFTAKRNQALSGNEDDDMVYVEFSADPDAHPDDRKQWSIMNPSHPKRTPVKAMLRMKKNMPDPDSWRREAMGIWDDDGGLVVNATKWSSLVGVRPEGRATAFGVACHNGQFSVVACWVDGDSVHVEEVFAHFRLDLVAEYLRKSAGRRRSIMVDESGSATALVPMLKADRMDVVGGSVRDTARGCELMSSRVDADSVTHTGQESLNAALASARRKPYRDSGAWIFDLKVDSSIAPAMALALALTAASGSKPKRTSSRREAISL